jgi:anaerobic carbon-monoxide dehydrogenase iron sulfur subunit
MNCFDWDEEQFQCGEGCDACIDSLVRFIPKNCMACKSCELACALRHSASGDINIAICEYPRPFSRLSIVHSDGKLHLITCVHCKHPKCIEVCKASAITKDGDGIVTINEESCVGCLECVEACPFEAIQARDHEAVKCDLCGGAAELSCVLACKSGALIYGQET